MRIIFIISLIISSSAITAFVQPLNNIDKHEKSFFSQIKLDVGSVVMLDQFMKNKYKSQDDDYIVKLKCKRKNKAKRVSNCSVIDYELLKK